MLPFTLILSQVIHQLVYQAMQCTLPMVVQMRDCDVHWVPVCTAAVVSFLAWVSASRCIALWWAMCSGFSCCSIGLGAGGCDLCTLGLQVAPPVAPTAATAAAAQAAHLGCRVNRVTCMSMKCILRLEVSSQEEALSTACKQGGHGMVAKCCTATQVGFLE